MRRLIVATVAALLLAGCASLPPYATERSMQDRARCLEAGGIWIEAREVYGCRAPEGA